MGDVVIGVDVGTGSARAGVFDLGGRLLGAARRPIRIWHEAGGIVEQSSDDIWAACAAAVRGALAEAAVDPTRVAGLGFDATCSLVVLDPSGRPLPVGPSGDSDRNVIVWMDHRAIEETRAINAGGHAVLAFVGGTISPEMQAPKLKWLSTHRPESFAAAGHFLDLSDFLTFRATGSTARSVCTVTCKWTYLAHEARWDDDFFRAIGLAALVDGGHGRIGETIVAPGTRLGDGLTAAAAAELGLRPGTPVAASLIDAHAGAVGTLGGAAANGAALPAGGRLAYILGTSACLMATTAAPAFVDGLWGPYFAALTPGDWLNEGGQSAAGAAIDRFVRMHPAFAATEAAAKAEGLDPLALIERRIVARLARAAGGAAPAAAAAPGAALAAAATLARDLHVLPDFLGNRSPFADPDARAAVLGLDLDDGEAGLEALYVAGLCGLGYGAAEVIGALAASGVACGSLVVSGGASRSPLVRRIIADATGLPVGVPETPEPVLLGAAMLGAVAGGAHPDLPAAMAAMSRIGAVVMPAGGAVAAFHAAKRRVFDDLRRLDRGARTTMAAAPAI